MKLFINSGVCERICNGGNVKIKQTIGKSQLCLSIPNYLKDKKKQEDINFVFNIIKDVKIAIIIPMNNLLKPKALLKATDIVFD